MLFWHDVGFQCARVSAQKNTMKFRKSTVVKIMIIEVARGDSAEHYKSLCRSLSLSQDGANIWQVGPLHLGQPREHPEAGRRVPAGQPADHAGSSFLFSTKHIYIYIFSLSLSLYVYIYIYIYIYTYICIYLSLSLYIYIYIDIPYNVAAQGEFSNLRVYRREVPLSYIPQRGNSSR